MLVCTDYRLEYKVDSIEDPQNREGRKAKGKRRKKGSKVGKTMSFKERKVELKSGSVETELESMEKKIDHM